MKHQVKKIPQNEWEQILIESKGKVKDNVIELTRAVLERTPDPIHVTSIADGSYIFIEWKNEKLFMEVDVYEDNTYGYLLGDDIIPTQWEEADGMTNQEELVNLINKHLVVYNA